MSTTTERRFGPTTDVIPGWVGLVLALLLAGWTALTEHSLVGVQVITGCLIFVLLIWCLMLRPRIILTPDRLVLRNTMLDVHIPVVLVDDIRVRQVTRVRVGEKRYVGLAVGRTRRGMARSSRPADPNMPVSARPTTLSASMLPDFVEEQVLAVARDARERALPAGPVTRTWAVWELVALGLLVLVLAGSFVA